MPAKYVRPYSKGQKNDFRDAEAIAEAVQRPTMKFVATKTADQLDLQALHRCWSDWSASAPASSSDSRLPVGARRCGAARVTVFARRAAAHPSYTSRCPVAPDGSDHRGFGWRLAETR